MGVTVLTPEQLATRWQVSLSKIYEDNNAGKLPQLPNHRTRFPLSGIEAMENEPLFDKNNVRTPRERKLLRELEDKNRLLGLQEDEIRRLKALIAKIQIISTEEIYQLSR